MFYLFGAQLALFLSLILLSKKGKTSSDSILTVWLVSIGLYLVLCYFRITNLDLNYPFLLGVIFPFPLIQGPLLFLYTAALTNQLARNKVLNFLHFLPALFSVLLFLPFYTLSSSDKILLFKNSGKGNETVMRINVFLILISGVIYIVWSLILLKRHKKNILNQFSNTDKINLKWLQYLIYSILVIWLFVFYGNDHLIFSCVVLFVTFLGYYGIKQVGIFSSNKLSSDDKKALFEVEKSNESLLSDPESTKRIEHPNTQLANSDTPVLVTLTEVPEADIKAGALKITDAETEEKKKYQKSGLTNEEALKIHGKLSEMMIAEKYYKNPELNLLELSKKLSIHPNALSQVINSIEKKNFYDYINDLRVAEFKEMVILPKNKKFTLLALALECGFNSKTTFNRNFKKSTGLSPSEYLNTLQVDISE